MSRLKIKSTLLFCSFFSFLMVSNVNAQIGKRIQQRIKQSTERKVEDKIVNKVEKKTDQALDSLFKEKTPSEDNSSEQNTEESSEQSSEKTDAQSEKSTKPRFNFGGMTNATYESSYTLNQEFKVEIRSQEKPKKKTEVVNLDMFYGENCYMMISYDEDGKKVPMKTLMDLKNNSSLMLNDEDMSGMAISMDFMTDKLNEAIAEQDSADVDDSYTFTKTGNTKMIAGYNCEEYLIETDESTMNVWYTEDITIALHENMGDIAMFASFSSAISKGSNGQLMGMMMESHMVEKTGDKGTFDYIVKEVNLVPSTVNIGDYTFMKM